MSSLDALVICLVFSAISLMAVSYVNRQQMRRRLVSQKIDQMKRRVVELEEVSALVDPLVENREILRFVLLELIDLINRTQNLDPDCQYLETNLVSAKDQLSQVSSASQPKLWRLLNSDAAIARARYALNEAGRTIRKRETLGDLTATELENIITELAWAHIMVGVITLVGQGHQAVHCGDVLKAYAYYKSAQQLLTHSNHPDTRRHQFIKELSEIMTNRKKAISLQLMPESEFNPSTDSKDLIIPDDDEEDQPQDAQVQ